MQPIAANAGPQSLLALRWASVGMPGNTHDSTNFQSTRLWHDVINGDILPHKAQMCSGLEVPPLILTDGAFPFRTSS